MIATKNPDSVRQDAARADALRLLIVFAGLPTSDFAGALCDGSVCADVESILEDLGAETDEIAACTALLSAPETQCADELFHAMRIDHTRLFDSPSGPVVRAFESQFRYMQKVEAHEARAYESFPPAFISDAALDAERCYRSQMVVPDENVRIPADHICTELEYAATLFRYRMEAALAQDDERIADLDSSLEEFLRLHGNRWWKAWFAAVAEKGGAVYSALGNIACALLDAALDSR